MKYIVCYCTENGDLYSDEFEEKADAMTFLMDTRAEDKYILICLEDGKLTTEDYT